MNSIGPGWRRYVSYHMPIGLFAAFWLVSAPAYTAESPALRSNPFAEQWVVKQVTADKIADLKERFPQEADRVLSAAFLAKLLTNSPKEIKVHRHGIRIRHATLTEPIDLENGEILHETWLEDCRFERGVNFVRSHFHRKLLFSGSTFNAGQRVTFEGMKVDDDIFFRKAVFAGPVIFRGANIIGQFIADEAHFTNPEQTADFNGMHVGDVASFQKVVFTGSVDFGGVRIGDFQADEAQFTNAEQGVTFHGMHVGDIASFRKTVFAGLVNFSRMTVASQFIADEAHFTNPEQTADFNGMHVGDTAFFWKAVFAGPVDFRRMTVATQFVAEEARLTNPDQTATFNGMQVGDVAFFRKAVFAGPVDFSGVKVVSNFEAQDAQFTNPAQTATFNSMQVGASAFFHKAVFAGPVDFAGVSVTSAFEAHDAQFTNAAQTVTFNGMQVGQTAFFQKAVFAGPVDFRGMKVMIQFKADEAQFTNPAQTAIFDSMQVGHTAFFRKAVFVGPVSMSGANFRDLLIEGPGGTASLWPHLNLSRTVINRQLRITHVTLQELLAPALRVEGPTVLSGITIKRQVDLQYSSFATLDLPDVSEFMDANAVLLLDGMTYQQLHVGSSGGKALLTEQKWKDLLALAEKAEYRASVYVTLETFLRQRGYSQQADAVFVAQKRRERRDIWGGPLHLAWWSNIGLDVLVRYGRHPEWAVIWSMFVVGIGYWVFHSRNCMDPRKDEDAARPYNAFWYSVDLFAPVINLEAANVWRPKDTYRWRLLYMRVQKILGWLLVPLGLAAWTGILK